MKPLNRPMFKYGGPIKEGIMTGMKEKQAINTVGSPLAPKDETGRGGYAAPLLPLIYSGLATAGRFALRPLGKFVAKQFARPGVTGSGNLIRSGLGRTRVMQPGESLTTTKNIFDPNVAGRYIMGSPEFKFGKTLVQGTGRFGKPIKSLATSAVKSPLTLGSIVYYGGGALLPDGTPDPNDPKNIKPVEEGGVTGTTKPGESGGTTVSNVNQDTLNQVSKDRIQKTKDRYYKLMGIDKMNKEAVYDSLIDASKIIQQEGGDLKGSIKSGSLQTQIIDAISKQLDKSSALKRQIDAAVLKGEIEKDINKEKNQLDAEYKRAAIKKMEAADGTLLSDIRSFVDKYQTLPSGTALAGLAKTRGMNIVKIADTQEVTDWISKNGGDEEDFIKSMIQDPENEVAPGVHVVNNALVEVGTNGSVTKLF